MSKRLKKGDQVTVNDGSWAIRMDDYETFETLHGKGTDQFTVLHRNPKDFINVSLGAIHDIHIQNNKTGAIYLHSERLVCKVPVPVKKPVVVVCPLCRPCCCGCGCHPMDSCRARN